MSRALVPWLIAWLLLAGVSGLWWALEGRDPLGDQGLRQLDLLYLDEPAPLADRLDLAAGEPTLLVVCEACEEPRVDARVLLTAEAEVARAYALLGRDGQVGPGYALIDADGLVRYRTFDARPADHVREIAVLIDAVRG